MLNPPEDAIALVADSNKILGDITMKKHVMKFLRDEEGLTIVEYAVAAGLIAAAVVLAFTNLGQQVLAIINNLIAALAPAAAGP